MKKKQYKAYVLNPVDNKIYTQITLTEEAIKIVIASFGREYKCSFKKRELINKRKNIIKEQRKAWKSIKKEIRDNVKR